MKKIGLLQHGGPKKLFLFSLAHQSDPVNEKK